MRRCAVSVVSNIVEGFARQGMKEKAQFYFHAKSSLVELQSQLEIAKDLKFVGLSEYQKVEQLIVEVQKMISGLIKKQKR
jgi:four helix bundle protein